jgi:glutaconate CoA-transferase subunit A
MDKLVELAEAARLVRDGDVVAFGGSLLHRIPAAFARELARQGRRDLTFVKPSAAYDLDLLCAAGCVRTVYAGIVTFEAPFGMAPSYRRAVEEGRVRLVEHA